MGTGGTNLVLTPSHQELIKLLDQKQAKSYWISLKRAHDLLMYNPDIDLDPEERMHMANVRVLSEQFFQIATELAMFKDKFSR